MVKCEVELLKQSTSNGYKYYHLISGVDLPLKTNDEINAFFDTDCSKNYIGFDPRFIPDGPELDRLRYYHFGKNMNNRYIKRLYQYSLVLQKKLGVNRIKKFNIPIFKGSNWFTINHKMAKYIVSKEAYIRKHYRFTHSGDEFFLHTLAKNSLLSDTIVNDGLRYIDWGKAGSHPKTFTLDDFDRLISSEKLFARKFSPQIDKEVIDKIYTYLKNKN